MKRGRQSQKDCQFGGGEDYRPMVEGFSWNREKLPVFLVCFFTYIKLRRVKLNMDSG